MSRHRQVGTPRPPAAAGADHARAYLPRHRGAVPGAERMASRPSSRGGVPDRHRSSRADAAEHYRQLGEHHLPEQAATAIERILVDGADAVVLGEIRQTARPTGRAYRSRFALHLTVEDGLVTRNHVYEDSLSVAQAFAADGR